MHSNLAPEAWHEGGVYSRVVGHVPCGPRGGAAGGASLWRLRHRGRARGQRRERSARPSFSHHEFARAGTLRAWLQGTHMFLLWSQDCIQYTFFKCQDIIFTVLILFNIVSFMIVLLLYFYSTWTMC